MIDGFEEYTFKLTDEEQRLLPYLRAVIRRHVGEEQAATAGQLSREVRDRYSVPGIEGPRMRKLIHNIRVSGDIEKLVASSRGYYIATTDEEVKQYAESLRERAAAILAVRKSLLACLEPVEQLLLGI